MQRLAMMLGLLLLASPAIAQDYSGLQSKIDRLERDLTFLQRQVYQGDPNASSVPNPSGASAGSTTVQFTQIQEEMRALRGQFEQLDFRIRKLEEDQRKRAEDIEFRLQQLENQASAVPSAMPVVEGTAPAATATPAVAAPATTPPKENGYDINASDPSAARTSTAQYEPAATAATPARSAGFATPREHYNHAFKLLNDAKYADASTSFSSFVAQHPKDALVPNAYYWMGESHYARRDFTKAAEGFRKGYEAAPKGQKAPDNLLKLSLSLANLKRKDEACIVLKQISAQYGATAKTTAAKADSEYKRLACA